MIRSVSLPAVSSIAIDRGSPGIAPGDALVVSGAGPSSVAVGGVPATAWFALAGTLHVEVDGPEMPIMDGSSLPFVRILDRAGLRPQEAARSYIEILDTVADFLGGG